MIDLVNAQERLSRVINLTVLVISLAITILIPLGYYLVASKYESGQLMRQADHAAEVISKIIYASPNTWKLQEPRLLDFLESTHKRNSRVRLAIVTTKNKIIITVGGIPEFPVMALQSRLSDGATTVGWIKASVSLRPLLFQVLLVFLGSFALAVAVNIVLRTLPFAALERAMESLAESGVLLKKEIVAKDEAYAELEGLNKIIHYKSLHDELTALPNRSYFLQELSTSVNCAVEKGENVGVLLIDLNRFKIINDTLGHQMGDEVLISVSKRFINKLADSNFLARLGGDEYAVILLDSSFALAQELAETLTALLRPHIVIDGYHLNVPASIGVSQFPEHGSTPSQLLRHADIAMYQAKRSGQPYCWYQSEIDNNTPDQLALTAELRNAIDKKQIHLHYQPKIDLCTGTVFGVEVLARWMHPKFGEVDPDTFIKIAERTGMINALTNLVLEIALKQLSEWRANHVQLHMSINISAQNIQNIALVDYIRNVAESYDVKPEWLTLEVTESSVMYDPEQARQIISNLVQWGASIAIDDFGIGYSSLSNVKLLDINELKIDRSFVVDITDNADDHAIVKSTIELSHRLGLTVTAEGVESRESFELIKELGCDYAQGFYICEPIMSEELTQWLKSESIEKLKMI